MTDSHEFIYIIMNYESMHTYTLLEQYNITI